MKIDYNGVSIEIPKEKTIFSHSLPLMIATQGEQEANKAIPYFQKLMEYKETELPEGELLRDTCCLLSLFNLNYQVCNGGFSQYYYNGYHTYRAGYDIGDLAHLSIDNQIEFLEKLIRFILLDTDKQKYHNDLVQALILLKEMPNSISDYEELDEEEKEYADIDGVVAFDNQWYKINEIVEWGIELYAQYLCKRLEEMSIEPTNQ